MSRRRFGGLFRFLICFTIILLCRAGSRAHASHRAQHGDFQAQGKICLYVDLQKEFDRTVRAVKDVLNFSDKSQQAKLNRTIYKGLLNRVISQSMYPIEIQDELPKADDNVVKELEEAGFVVLANLAKKDYSVAVVETNNDEGLVSTQHVTSRSGKQPEDDEVPMTSPRDNYSPHIEGDNQHGVSSSKHCHQSTRGQTQNYHETARVESYRTTLTSFYHVLRKSSSTSQSASSNKPILDKTTSTTEDHNKRNPNSAIESEQTLPPSLETTSTCEDHIERNLNSAIESEQASPQSLETASTSSEDHNKRNPNSAIESEQTSPPSLETTSTSEDHIERNLNSAIESEQASPQSLETASTSSEDHNKRNPNSAIESEQTSPPSLETTSTSEDHIERNLNSAIESEQASPQSLETTSTSSEDHNKRNPNSAIESEQASAPSLETNLTTSEDLQSTKVSHPMYHEVAPAHIHDSLVNVDGGARLVNRKGLPIIEDDLYWSTVIEAATPKGFRQHEIDEWKAHLSEQSVRSFEPGTLNKCGRYKNRFIVLEDGSQLCARYRYPFITSMTGELYSYHLARMLGLTNLPPLHISVATTNDSFWRGQGSNFQDAGWEDGKVVILTKWIEDLDDAFFPETLIRGPFPVGAQNSGLTNLTIKDLSLLLQWSDLLLFDYLIAHFDRLTINLSSVRHYNDTSLMRSQVHNLARHPPTNLLWIVDNESGLIDGYSFLLVEGNKDSLLQGVFHEELLQKICIFRRSTVERVRGLLSHPNPARLLSDRVRREDPSGEGVFPSLDQIQGHAALLKERLGKIQTWIQKCQKRNAANRDP